MYLKIRFKESTYTRDYVVTCNDTYVGHIAHRVDGWHFESKRYATLAEAKRAARLWIAETHNRLWQQERESDA